MKNALHVTALLALLTLNLLPCRASIREELQKQYDRFAKAYVQNDVETLLSILAPDYTLKDSKGKTTTFAQYKDILKKRKADNKKTSAYKTILTDVKVKGETALATTMEKNDTTEDDPNTGELRKVVHIHQYKDTWIRLKGGWRLKRTESAGERTEPAKP